MTRRRRKVEVDPGVRIWGDAGNRKVVVVGIAPAPSSKPGDPPLASSTASGRRLEELVGRPVEHAFARANVLLRAGDSPRGDEARTRASVLKHVLAGRKVVALGHVVSGLLGSSHKRYFEWHRAGDLQIAVIPHPSGLNRWWNAPANVRTAKLFLRSLALETATAA